MKRFELKEKEFNYLVAALDFSKFKHEKDKIFFVCTDVGSLVDMLARLKGLYENFNESEQLNEIAKQCYQSENLKEFRQLYSVPRTR